LIDAAAEGVLAPAEMPRRLVLRPCLQVTQHQRSAIFLRQAPQFFIQHQTQLTPGDVVQRIAGRLRNHAAFVSGAAPRLSSQALSAVVGNAVQPTAQRLALANRTCLASQDEERGLEGVLSVLSMVQDAAAHAQHHRTMTLHQRGECRFRSLVQEAFEQLLIGERIDRLPGGHGAEMAEEIACGGHVRVSG